MNSMSPASAHWRSSNTRMVVPLSEIRSKKVRHAVKSSSRPPGAASPTPSSDRSAGSICRRSASSSTNSASVAAIRSRVATSSSSSRSPARRRTISPRAQKVTPSPKDGERPWCQ